MIRTTLVTCLFLAAAPVTPLSAGGNSSTTSDEKEKAIPRMTHPDTQPYLDFFQEVYDTVHQNYFYSVDDKNYQRFLADFDAEFYPEMRQTQKSPDYIKWRSAAHLVDYLKAEDDIFSAFFPPKAAENYEKEVLGKRVDLGVEGTLTDQGYIVLKVEPRSDAYQKGLRQRDVIMGVAGQIVLGLSTAKLQELLNPLEGETVRIDYIAFEDRQRKAIDVVSQEYFKQTVFLLPVNIPGIFCLRIERFNRMTADDLTKFMVYILREKASGLIIDLRGNPGGPPLAAREISSFFLTPGEEFAHFEKRGEPTAMLDVPVIPPPYRYAGDIVVLVDEQSGSASELFSGVLQNRGRAVLMGQNTAGQVFLKSMFNFSDRSMVLLVTARGHKPDGSVFSFKGVDPDERVSLEGVDLIQHAAEFLAARRSATGMQGGK